MTEIILVETKSLLCSPSHFLGLNGYGLEVIAEHCQPFADGAIPLDTMPDDVRQSFLFYCLEKRSRPIFQSLPAR